MRFRPNSTVISSSWLNRGRTNAARMYVESLARELDQTNPRCFSQKGLPGLPLAAISRAYPGASRLAIATKGAWQGAANRVTTSLFWHVFAQLVEPGFHF